MKRTLLHGLFPLVRAEILRLLFTNLRAELYVRQLSRLSDLSLQTVQDELAKLEAAHLIASRSNGYHRFYRANSKHPLYATLRKLVVRAATQAKPSRKQEVNAELDRVSVKLFLTALCGRVMQCDLIVAG